MDAVTYKNGQKNNWRRAAWNAIANATENPADALVLYLPGSTDLDRPEALRRGFKPANLIAVERNEAVTAKLRASGVTVIVGDLNDVLASWPVSVPIGAVLADFQCGVTKTVEKFMRLWSFHPATKNAGAVVNVMRGRDPENNWRAALTYEAAEDAMGDSYLDSHVNMFLQSGVLDMGSYLSAKRCHFSFAKSRAPALLSLVRGRLTLCKPEDALLEPLSKFAAARILPSYRSTPRSPVFDSVFLRVNSPREPYTVIQPEKTGMRQIAAALAVRTRRLRGELGGGARA
jgi:hypothetical protein